MPRALYVPTPSHTARVFAPETYAALLAGFEVTENTSERAMISEDVAAQAAGVHAIITGWGCPQLTAEVFEAATDLSIIAHTAGSVRAVLTDEAIERYVRPRDIVVFSANGAIALNVAEATVGMLIMGSRRWIDHVARTRAGEWRDGGTPFEGQFLSGATVGVVSASKVGLETIRLLKAFDCHILLYDPCVSDERVAELGVERAGLDELFARSDMVTLHAPSIPATRHLVGAAQLAMLRDGATLVNTARGSVIDEDALVAECKKRDLKVILDVTDPEPPAQDSELRALPNVCLLPHIAGCGTYGYHRIGAWTLEALRDHFAGRPVRGAVPLERFAEIA